MSDILDVLMDAMRFNRQRTLALVQEIEQDARCDEMLGWRPADGRAHVAWQLMHIGITEEVFACERLAKQPAEFPQHWQRFRGGSTPDDDLPSLDEIQSVLQHTRGRLLETISGMGDDKLEEIAFVTGDNRELTLQETLHLIAWHEGHHQGQAHITRNLFLAAS